MNVLLLTPDRVGSTLLQRTLTIYMLRRGFEKPVINLHELTNGIELYYNPVLNQEVLGKPQATGWAYYQKLEEITDLLKSVDHYKTSRLAHYHIKKRGDTLDEQIKFYEYLNKNFFIISCRRKNVFEHALSWVIQSHSKELNVYSPEQKIVVFDEIYKQGITAQETGFIKYLNAYRDYMEWSDKFFNVQSYFNYEDSINDLENYILNLDFMKKENNSWKDMFNIDFDTWNKCHKLIPDLMLHKDKYSFSKQLEFNKFKNPGLLIPHSKYEDIKGSDWPDRCADRKEFDQLNEQVKSEIISISSESLPINFPNRETYEFINNNIESYVNTTNQLNDLVNNGFLVTSVPIKLQTLKEKKEIVKNYDDCIKWYNDWVDKTGFGERFKENSDINLLEESKFTFQNFNSNNLLGNN
jgi:hypothetical protein